MPDIKNKHILIVAGEASGDLHGSALVRAIKRLDQEIIVSGIGGKKMEEAGVDIIVPASDLAVVGMTEVFPKIMNHLRAYAHMRSFLKKTRPDLLVLIDYPYFNIFLARTAKHRKVPVLYYISPQIWGWWSGRVKKIAGRVNKMAVILPFEKDFYMKAGADIDVEYVGHPLMDAMPDNFNKGIIARELGLDEGMPVLGLLPGSRTGEVINLLPSMIGAAEILSTRYDGLQCVLPLAPTLSPEFIKSFTDRTALRISICRKDIYSALSVCDIALVASGTATLETALMGVPMVVAYRMSPISFAIGKRVAKVSHVSLVNLIAGEEIVPEILQDAVTPESLADKASEILDNEEYRKDMIMKMRKVRESVGGKGASERTARIAIDMVNNKDRQE